MNLKVVDHVQRCCADLLLLFNPKPECKHIVTEQPWPCEIRSIDFTIDLDRVFSPVVIQVDLTEKREQNFLSELEVLKPAVFHHNKA